MADAAHHRAVPIDHFGQMAVTVVGRLPGILRTDQITAIDHVEATRAQCFAEASDAQGFGTHGATAVTCADIGGDADKCDRTCCWTHSVSLHRPLKHRRCTASGVKKRQDRSVFSQVRWE